MKIKKLKIQNQEAHLHILKNQKLNHKKLRKKIFPSNKSIKAKIMKFNKMKLNKLKLKLFKNNKIQIIVMRWIQF